MPAQSCCASHSAVTMDVSGASLTFAKRAPGLAIDAPAANTQAPGSTRQLPPDAWQSASLEHSVPPSPAARRNSSEPPSAVSRRPSATHRLLVHGPPAPQSAFEAQVNGTPALDSGKYCNPIAMPDVSGARTKLSSEVRTASHFVLGLSAAGSGSSIDPDRSSI